MRCTSHTAVFALLLIITSALLLCPAQAGDLMYTPEQIRSISAAAFLDRMVPPEEGYQQFAALNAVIQKGKESDASARKKILTLAMAIVKDESKPFQQRWECCYVLGGIGDDKAVPFLIQVLQEGSGLSVFAAEALADFCKDGKCAAAREALLKAARTNSAIQEVVARRLGMSVPVTKPGPGVGPIAASGVEELAPCGPPEPPAAPKAPVDKPLPWPFPGNQEDQRVFNNYQQATDAYIHCGLDLIHEAGTPVTAVASGYVALVYTNYPEWITHHFFIVTTTKGGNKGWCYTHMDPRTYKFKVGDYIRQGQPLGSLVDFSVGSQPGVSHLHLHYVSFSRDRAGKVVLRSLMDPLYFFDWKDTQPPTFQPLRVVREGTIEPFDADAAGVVTVNGKVDILAAIADGAFPDHMGNLGVPVVMFSISDGSRTMQKLVIDHRGDVGDEKQTRPIYLSYEEKKAVINPDSFPRYQVLRVTKTDGDGKITPKDATQCWDTTAVDQNGKPMWPDGVYSVNVYAWDIGNNRAVAGVKVRVSNERNAR